MTGNIALLQNVKSIKGGYVAFAGDKGGSITGEGTVTNGTISLEKVNYVEQLQHNLLSVSQICDKQFSMHFTDSECLILKPGFVIPDEWILMRAPRRNDTYILDMSVATSTAVNTCLLSKASEKDSILWHRKMGHIHFRKMNYLVKNGLVTGVPTQSFSMLDDCIPCKKGKQHRKTHKPKLNNSISAPLELLHMDLFGPISIRSIGGKSYCLVVTDDFSRFSWVYFLGTKDETPEILKYLFVKLENICNLKIKSIRSDNGTEFKNYLMEFFCLQNGIHQQFSAPRVPQQNGVAERKNRTIIETARTMLADSKLPVTFWAEAVNMACYVLNRVLTVKRYNKTCYELLNNRKPNLEHLQPFGTPCTLLKTNERLSKFEEKAIEGFFLGFVSNSSNKRVFNKSTGRIEEWYHVDCSKYSTPQVKGPDWGFDYDTLFKSFNILPELSTDEVDLIYQSANADPVSNTVPRSSIPNSVTQEDAANLTPPGTSGSSSSQPEDHVDDDGDEFQDTSNDIGNLNDESSPSETVLGEIPSNLESTIQVEDNPTLRVHKNHPMENIIGDPHAGVQTRQRSNSDTSCLYSSFQESGIISTCLYACFISQTEPKNVDMALRDNSWVEAMQEELAQFKKLQVWDLVDCPTDILPIGTKWVFKCKKDDRGVIVRNKARLVVQGFNQQEGIDYNEVYAPVARLEAIRMFLAFASYRGFKVYQLDVKSAFLYGKVKEEVYVCQPPGFEDPDYPSRVYKLDKALYGLHQAPRAWYETLSKYLLEQDFERGQIDSTLFIRKAGGDFLMVQIYVDDIIFGSTNVKLCKEFEKVMKSKFEMSAMGELSFFLGLQVNQKKDGLFIHQEKYVHDILTRFKMNDCSSYDTPIAVNHKLSTDADGDDVDPHLYRAMIGSLMYLTASRPDIMFAVCLCSRFQSQPKESHLKAVKRIFRYLKGKPKLGLWYPMFSDLTFTAYTDSDFRGCNLDRKSTSGGCQLLGSRLISWQCKKQTTVAISTCEAEYVAASSCCSQVLWIQQQLRDYGLNFLNTPIYIDNNATMSIVNNPVKHSKTKHIEVRHHFIRDCAEKKLIELIKIDTLENYADLFTKAFDRSRFEYLVQLIGMKNPE